MKKILAFFGFILVASILFFAISSGYYPKADVPESLLSLYERNTETRDFVLSYPRESKKNHKTDLTDCLGQNSVPLLMQWDKRWGYEEYSGDYVALTGCGPVCLSMVAIHLLQDASMTPHFMIDFAERYNYYENGHGSTWTLIGDGAEKIGLHSKELPLSKSIITDNLQKGNPIICVMGPGDFTTSGHFIVLTGYSEEGFTVNDPNSRENSSKLWSYERIESQIKNLWAITIGNQKEA